MGVSFSCVGVAGCGWSKQSLFSPRTRSMSVVVRVYMHVEEVAFEIVQIYSIRYVRGARSDLLVTSITLLLSLGSW